jgi:hypothetical protein
VLITDENSQVIGSGDVSRVGTVHEASVAVVKSGVAASHNAEEAAALVGVRPGITMPIVLDGEVIGTVGITGSPAQVVRLGRLVQRQTEILLRESMFQRTRLLRANRLAQLVRDIVEFDPRILGRTKGPRDMDSRVLTPELAGEIADETTRILGADHQRDRCRTRLRPWSATRRDPVRSATGTRKLPVVGAGDRRGVRCPRRHRRRAGRRQIRCAAPSLARRRGGPAVARPSGRRAAA